MLQNYYDTDEFTPGRGDRYSKGVISGPNKKYLPALKHRSNVGHSLDRVHQHRKHDVSKISLQYNSTSIPYINRQKQQKSILQSLQSSAVKTTLEPTGNAGESYGNGPIKL